MKITTRLTAAAIALPLILISASVFAFPGKDHKDNGGMQCKKMHDKNMLAGIDLSQAQENQIEAMRKNNREQRKGNRQEMMTQKAAEHKQMQTLLLAPDFNEKEIRALAEKSVNQQLTHRMSMLKQRHDMLNILTPQQKEQVKQNMEKMPLAHQKRMKHQH